MTLHCSRHGSAVKWKDWRKPPHMKSTKQSVSTHIGSKNKSSAQTCYILIKLDKYDLPLFLVSAAQAKVTEKTTALRSKVWPPAVCLRFAAMNTHLLFGCSCFHPPVSCEVQHFSVWICRSKKENEPETLQYIYLYIYILLKSCNLKLMYFLNSHLCTSEYYLNI